MGLSSCLCQPRYASFLNLVEKIDSINSYSYTLQQASPDSGVLLKDTLAKELLGDIFYHHKEAQNREVRLVGVSQPYAQVLVCAFNIKSIGFEWKTNETFLVTYGYEGKLDKDQNLCLDNYYHTFYYRIDEQGRIVRLRKGKIVPYKYNHSDHAYDSNPCGDPKNYVFIQL